jgi:tripartite ATP-independent transporter DctP family solute receptor
LKGKEMSKNKFMAITISSVIVAIIAIVSYEIFNKNMSSEKIYTEKSIVLRLADIQSEGYPTVLGDNEFAMQLEKKTNGRIKVEVYPLGKLGDENSTVEQAKYGAIDIIRVSASSLVKFDKQMEVVLLPYIFTSREQMFRVLDGTIGDKLFNGLQNNGKVVGLAWFDAGARNFYTNRKYIKAPEDLKNMKIRVQQDSKPMSDMVKVLGAEAVPMGASDVYNALQTGVIDGAENNLPSYLSFKHNEVSRYIIIDEHTRVPEIIVMSKLTWDKISEEDQKLVLEAAKEGAKLERSEWVKQELAAQAQIIQKGCIITQLKSNDAFRNAVQPMYNEYSEYKDLIEQILNTK